MSELTHGIFDIRGQDTCWDGISHKTWPCSTSAPGVAQDDFPGSFKPDPLPVRNQMDPVDFPRKPVTAANPKAALGAKRVPLGLLPAAGPIHGALAMEFGAYHAGKNGTGYGPYNWRESESISLIMYLDAMERHIKRIRDGEDLAPDSKVDHLGHLIADASILLDAKEMGNLTDDRPAKGPAAALLERLEKERSNTVKSTGPIHLSSCEYPKKGCTCRAWETSPGG